MIPFLHKEVSEKVCAVYSHGLLYCTRLLVLGCRSQCYVVAEVCSLGRVERKRGK